MSRPADEAFRGGARLGHFQNWLPRFPSFLHLFHGRKVSTLATGASLPTLRTEDAAARVLRGELSALGVAATMVSSFFFVTVQDQSSRLKLGSCVLGAACLYKSLAAHWAVLMQGVEAAGLGADAGASEDLFARKVKAIVRSFMQYVPREADNPENERLLVEEITSLGRFLSPATNSRALRSLIQTRLLDFKLSMEAIKKNVGIDNAEIAKIFLPKEAADGHRGIILSKIVQTDGETHNGGVKPSSIELRAPGGGVLKLVYKPRSIAIDNLICGDVEGSLFCLVNRLASGDVPSGSSSSSSSLSAADDFSKVKISLPVFPQLSRNGYGYAKFLSHEQNDYYLDNDYYLHDGHMLQYYFTIGAIQAISQIFGISDLHQGNVVVHSKRPDLVDLEVAFDVRSLNTDQQTHLFQAVYRLGDVEAKHATNNEVVWVKGKDVVWVNDEDVVPMETHYNNKKTVYFEGILKGFSQLQQLVISHNEEFLGFIKQAAEDSSLVLRYLIVGTGSLQAVLQDSPAMWGREFHHSVLKKLFEEHFKYFDLIGPLETVRLVASSEDASANEELICALVDGKRDQLNTALGSAGVDAALAMAARLSEVFEESARHGDIPAFSTDMKGGLYFGSFLLGTAKKSGAELASEGVAKARSMGLTGFFLEPEFQGL